MHGRVSSFGHSYIVLVLKYGYLKIKTIRVFGLCTVFIVREDIQEIKNIYSVAIIK